MKRSAIQCENVNREHPALLLEQMLKRAPLCTYRSTEMSSPFISSFVYTTPDRIAVVLSNI